MQEWAADRREMRQRDAAVRADKVPGGVDQHVCEPSYCRLVGGPDCGFLQLPGTYTAFDKIDTEALQRVAEHFGRRELAPLNTTGKYNTRYMKDRYPIAGTQLKLQQERDIYLRARKKLLLDAKTREIAHAHSDCARSGPMCSASYTKLDYQIDTMTKVLAQEQELVRQQESERQLRMVEVRNQKSLEQLWQLISSDSHRCEPRILRFSIHDILLPFSPQ